MDNYYYQYGGSPLWYNQFDNEMKFIYNTVKQYTGNLTLTGSAAIAYMLKYLNMNTELNTMTKPNDLDLLYVDVRIDHPNIPNFTKSTHSPVKSITYTRQTINDPNSINSFDLMFIPKDDSIYNVSLNGISVLHPKKLLNGYKLDLHDDIDARRNNDEDKKKIDLLEKILLKINNDATLSQQFECKKFNPNDIYSSEPSVLSDSSDSLSTNLFSTPKKQKTNEFTTPTGGFNQDFYKHKYLKYKKKYLDMKKNI